MRRTRPRQSWALMAAVAVGGYYLSRALPGWLSAVDEYTVAAATRVGGAHPSATYLPHEHGFRASMDLAEARLILGYPATGAAPAADDVQKRYRAAMAVHHADVGGSRLVSQKINEARDLLTR